MFKLSFKFYNAQFVCMSRYKQYTMLDPLGVVKKTRTAMEEESEIDAAPTTITTNEGLQGQKVDDISFKPVIVDFPEIAVPDFLPNLPGILILTVQSNIMCATL